MSFHADQMESLSTMVGDNMDDYVAPWDEEIDIFSNGDECPECDGIMKKRHGKRGPFAGCSNYPDCSFTGDWMDTGHVSWLESANKFKVK